MSASVHVVIVNWNTGGYLRECVAALAAADREPARIERITVVDNASSDGSADGLDAGPVPLEVIRNTANVGFAAACNQGAATASADYLLFLNPDTRVRPDTLARVTEFMERPETARIGICGVQVLDADGRPGISCARFPTLRVMAGKITGLDRVLPGLFPHHHLPPAETRDSREVDQVIGAFFFVRAPLFARLGGFDTRYFLYFEEVDLALRARQAGFPSYFLREATVVHAANVSSSQVVDARLYHSLRSRLLFAFRHWPRWQAGALVLLTFTVELAARLARGAVRREPSDLLATAIAYGRLARWAAAGTRRSNRDRAAAGAA